MPIIALMCLAIALSAFPSQSSSQAAQFTAGTTSPLQRRVSSDAESDTLTEHIALLLQKAGTWGGIEDYDSGCVSDSERKIPAFDGTLEEGLTRLKKETSSLRWRIQDDGVLVSRGAVPTSTLDLIVDQFTFGVNDPPSRVTDALLSASSIAREMAAQKILVKTPELGFAQPKTASEENVTLTNVSLRQVLNTVAHLKESHHRVWLFEQMSCAGRKTVLIQWIVK